MLVHESKFPVRLSQALSIPPPSSPPGVCDRVTAPALHTARTLLQNFTVGEKEIPGREPAVIPVTEFNLALVIDLCTAVHRLAACREQIGGLIEKVRNGTASNEDVAVYLRDLSIAFNWMPSY